MEFFGGNGGSGSASGYEAEKFSVALPEFDVTVNGITISTANHDREVYPFVVYNGITYLPLTYSYTQLLGLDSVWSNENGLVICRRDLSMLGTYNSGQFPNTQMAESTQRHEPVLEFSGSSTKITAVGKKLTGEVAGWPILEFSNVTYIPLTYEVATEYLGCYKYEYTAEKGLELCAESKFVANLQYVDHAYHDRVVTKVSNEMWYYCKDIRIRVNCGSQRFTGPFSQNMIAYFNDGTKKQFGQENDCFGYSDAPEDEKRWVGGDTLEYSDGYIYTTYGSYWGGKRPHYCKINIETGEITILEKQQN